MLKTKRIPAVLLGTAFVFLSSALSAFGQAEKAPFYHALGSPVAGGKLFMTKGCNTCHAIYGLGGEQGPDLGKARAASTFLDMAGLLWNHQPRMEQEYKRLNLKRPTLNGREIVDLISFVYYLGYFGDPGDADEGELVFFRNRCAECHTVGDHGDTGLPLDHFQSYRSPAFISSALWNGGKGISRALERKNISLPEPEGNDLADLLAFIRRDASPEERIPDVYLPPGNPRKGEVLVESKSCLRCHTVAGGTGEAPTLGSSRFGGTLSQLGASMWIHEPSMWESLEAEGIPFPELSPEEMSDLTAYLYFSSFIDEPGDVHRGEEIFIAKGCAKCHEPGVDHEDQGIEVTDMDYADAPGIIAAMWNHASRMDTATRSVNVEWPQFRSGEMAHLVAYIESR